MIKTFASNSEFQTIGAAYSTVKEAIFLPPPANFPVSVRVLATEISSQQSRPVADRCVDSFAHRETNQRGLEPGTLLLFLWARISNRSMLLS
jgi:hypothetical protein